MCLVLRRLKETSFPSGDPDLRTPKEASRALRRGPRPREEVRSTSGKQPCHLPTRTPVAAAPGWEQYFPLDSVSLGLHSRGRFHHCSHKQNGTMCFCAVFMGPCCVPLSQGTFSPQSLSVLLVSGTFFFPTSEINEISISHLTQSDYASPPPPHK